MVGAGVVAGAAVGSGPLVPGVVGACDDGTGVDSAGFAVGAPGLGGEGVLVARLSGFAVGISAGFIVGADEAQTWIICASSAT